jgi:hypothetical protein
MSVCCHTASVFPVYSRSTFRKHRGARPAPRKWDWARRPLHAAVRIICCRGTQILSPRGASDPRVLASFLSSMNVTRLVLLALLPFSLAAADASRLQQLLRQYPEADTNRDGTLSLQEAQAHANKLRQAKKSRSEAPGVYDDAA